MMARAATWTTMGRVLGLVGSFLLTCAVLAGAGPRGKGARSNATVVTGDVNVVNSQVTIVGNAGSSNAVVGNGKRVQRELPVPAQALTGVDLSGVFEADIVCGKPAKVQLTVDENLQELASVTVERGLLGVRFSKPVQTRESPRLEISVPALDKVRLTGGDTVRVTQIDGKQLLLEQSGTGGVTLAGAVHSFACKVGGVGDVDAADLKCGEATVSVTGVGSVTCRPERKLKATITGIGGVRCLTWPAEVLRDGSGIGEIEYVEGR